VNQLVFSSHLDLDDAFRRASRKVPLVWARSGSNAASNFGDAASAVIVSAICGREIAARNFNDPLTRIAAIGTIGQNMSFGTVHMWGTGIDASARAFGNRQAAFAASPDTKYTIHAVRGPNSRKTLLEAGIYAPPIYGDGAWFLPRIIKNDVEKRHELGVVLHLSELEDLSITSKSRHARHSGGESDGVKFISTRHEPNWVSFKEKLVEILSCKRIVSTSFHGMAVADAYKIPCLYFPIKINGAAMLGVNDGPEVLDHRFSDFYKGAGSIHVPAFGQPLSQATAWDQVINAVDKLWKPVEHRHAEIFFDAFPMTPNVSFSDAFWPVNYELFNSYKW
jgi:hypothetical protein